MNHGKTTVMSRTATHLRCFRVQLMIAKRKAAGLLVDPGTAEICSVYGESPDRHGDLEVMPDEWSQIGRNYLGRLSPSDPWIWFGGLPDTVRNTG
jgi:hypothetical protein